jgi:ribosome-associated toxin RatA of RatAB toxin-antitoxin module
VTEVTSTSYQIRVQRRLNVPPSVSFQVVEDVANFPTFMPNVEEITLLEDTATRKVALWKIVIDEAPLEWVEEGIYSQADLTVVFRALDGVFDRFDGRWSIVPDGACSEIHLELDYELGLPEIEEIIGPILRERLRANALDMLAYIEDRISSEGP